MKEPITVGYYETYEAWGGTTRTKQQAEVWAYKKRKGVRLYAALYGPNGYVGSYFYLNVSATCLSRLLALAGRKPARRKRGRK